MVIMKKNNQKENFDRGITLIALVITIIVLLILAGVTIATLTGENGILTRTREAKQESKKSKIKEQIQLAYLEYKIENSHNTNINLEDFIRKTLEKTYGTGNVITTQMGKNCKVDIVGINKIYILKYDGNIKELERIEKISETDIYGKVDEEGTLTLRATKIEGYEKERLESSRC